MSDTPNPPVPVNPADWTPLIEILRATLQPLAESNAQTQQRAIEADLEKHRINVAANQWSAWRGFIIASIALVIVAGAIWKFLEAGQFNFAYNALAFAAGAALGFGVGRARQ